MPALTESDTIRILVATDNHVGYGERDPIRKEDSWRSFDEIMTIAKDREVDMVLLAGDLFHDNKPSRQAMYHVMRSLRMNCLGEKPCELEMLSDKTEAFEGAFNHVNYEDPDINVAIPVFSIHGNHDDPTGEGHLAALDLLQIGGLVNYYGRTHESDNIHIKPVLLQKGHTKLALYGMSNVRDERLFRTFRDGRVKFYRPAKQGPDWFNIMSVHQNHHAYTETGYLPETFLPDFMDLVVWGHEHECLIDPRTNPETGFRVMQPGSSVATSLVPGESVAKHVAIVSITGREFESEPIRLKSVRPFKMREIALAEDRVAKKLAKKENNRTELTRRMHEIVEELIEEAKAEWLEAQDDPNDDEQLTPPLPLIRLRVEYTAPEGGSFDCENPQRFSNRFVGKVANVNDVVQFHRRKAGTSREALASAELPSISTLGNLTANDVKVERLVREFLTAQSLTILPQNSFGDAVSQFVDKDDKHAMETFVSYSLKSQVEYLLDLDQDEDEIHNHFEANKSQMEKLFAAGLRKNRPRRLKPKPDKWDTDVDGNWSDEPIAFIHSDVEDADNADSDAASVPAAPTQARGRGRRAGGRGAASTRAAPTKRGVAASKKTTPATKPAAHGRKKAIVEDDEEDSDLLSDNDVEMLDDDDGEEESQPLFVNSQPSKPMRGGRKSATATTTASKGKGGKKVPARAAANRSTAGQNTARAVSDDIVDDDDEDEDAFEPVPAPIKGRGRR